MRRLRHGGASNALERTVAWRPDLLEGADLTPEERARAADLLRAREGAPKDEGGC